MLLLSRTLANRNEELRGPARATFSLRFFWTVFALTNMPDWNRVVTS